MRHLPLRAAPFRWWVLLTLLWAVFASTCAIACSIPVFRYGLERWDTDPYEVYVFHRGPLNATQKEQAETLIKLGQDGDNLANILVQMVDLASDKVEDDWKEIFAQQAQATLPWVVVRKPHVGNRWPDMFAGPLSAAVKELPQSPVRQEIVKHLMAGESAVWVLVECGNKAKDDAVYTMLTAQLPELEKTLKLPEKDPNDPRILTDLPLAIKFTVVRLARTDPAEKYLITQLLKSELDWPGEDEPLVFPVFGRGRSLNGYYGRGITAENISDAAEFITGPCGCEVKRQSPGFDLQLQGAWHTLIHQERMLGDAPPLTGISKFVPPAKTTDTDPQPPANSAGAVSSGNDPAMPATTTAEPAAEPAAANKNERTDPGIAAGNTTNSVLVRNVVVGAILGIVLVAALTAIFFRR